MIRRPFPHPFALLFPLAFTFACGGGSEGDGTGGGSNTGGGSSTGGVSSGGNGTGGTGTGGATTGGSSGDLDLQRVETARKMKRRISLGDSDASACIVTAAGGIECRGFYDQDETFAQPVDLVAFSGLGYCVIMDDGSVECDFADNVGDEARTFADGLGSKSQVVKRGTDALLTIAANGDIRAWTGSAEVTSSAPAESVLAGYDDEACTLDLSGTVSCFMLLDSDRIVDKAGFAFQSTAYADLDQSRDTIGGITTAGLLRIRNRSEDNDLTYQDLFVQVATERDYWCMLDNVGSVRCDAYNPADLNSSGLNNPPAGEFLVVDVNEEFACGVRPTGAVECWGESPPTFDSLVRLD